MTNMLPRSVMSMKVFHPKQKIYKRSHTLIHLAKLLLIIFNQIRMTCFGAKDSLRISFR